MLHLGNDMQLFTAESDVERCRTPSSMKCGVKSATHKQKYHLDMLADSGGEQKRTAMISGRALTDAINEDNKRGEGDLSGRYSDIPGKTVNWASF